MQIGVSSFSRITGGIPRRLWPDSARTVVWLCGFLTAALLAGCQGETAHSAPPAAQLAGTTAPNLPSANTAAAQTAGLPAGHPVFDGDRAFALLKQQCEFGARPLGSAAHEKTRSLLLETIRKYADKTVTQEFPYRGMPVTNIVGVFYPEGSQKPSARPVILMSHWDTRPIADGPFSDEIRDGIRFRYGKQGWKPNAPIIGANDGASGTAVLLELARLFAAKRPPVGVVIVLDDGEDYGDFQQSSDGAPPEEQGEGVELGSRYFAKHYRGSPLFGQPSYGILLDMVGAKNCFFAREDASQQAAPWVNDKVFGIAQSLGYSDVFRSGERQAVGDDHIALIAQGIPMIDLIHPLPYPPYDSAGYRAWHTKQDVPAQCSARALRIVGEVVAEAMYRDTPGP